MRDHGGERFNLPGALLVLLGSGCFTVSGASSNAIPLVRLNAEKDLECPAKEIRITQLLGGKFEAIGCGHRAEYLTACEGLRCVVEDQGKAVPWRTRPEPLSNPSDPAPIP